MISVSPGEKEQGAAMGGKPVFARLKTTNATAVKHSNHRAVHSAVHIEPRTTSWGGREQNFPLTNAAGLCRAAGELLARETIRRRKGMERESNYPSAKTDASPDTGPSPGQTDVGSDVCTDCFYGGAGKGLLGVPCGIADGPAHITVSLGRLEGTQLLFPGTLARGAPRDSTLQPGMAVLCGDGAQAELCWCKGRRASA